jgi:hypothetical protein
MATRKLKNSVNNKKAVSTTRYEKLDASYGQIKIGAAAGDIASLKGIPAKNIIYGKFTTNAATPNVLQVFSEVNDNTVPVTFSIAADTTLINYELTYLNGTGHAGAGLANGKGDGALLQIAINPPAPTATTNAASSLATTGATLNGTVNPQSGSTTVTFQYGLTTGYGTTVTATQSPVTGNSGTAVSKAITGLVTGTLYHYRVVATNAGGTTNGSDQTFTTL